MIERSSPIRLCVPSRRFAIARNIRKARREDEYWAT